MKCIVYQRPGEPAARLFPSPSAQRVGESEADFFARIAAKDVPAGLAFKIMDSDDPIFADRTFRDAWTFDGSKIGHDMPKARAIHMERLREARDAALARLDVEALRAVERDDRAELARIAARKQALRDLPATINLESAATPEALKAKWHSEL